jgi:hypothetical protein
VVALRSVSRWIAAFEITVGKLMMTVVRIEAAIRPRLLRIIVVMGWITHAADVTGSHVPSGRALRPPGSPR